MPARDTDPNAEAPTDHSDPAVRRTINRDSYNAIARAWDAARAGFHGTEREWLARFLDGLPAPSRILDLGCGSGRPFAECVLALGHRLTGVDQAAALLDLARQRLPNGEWIESRIEDFRMESRYDGVLCWDALFHLERSQHAALIGRIAAALPAGGRLMLTAGGSAHPAFTDTMFGETFFYDSLPPDELLALLRETGFATLAAELINQPTGGRDKGRLAVLVQKA